MGLAIELAGKAQNPGPNPYVGAVLVKNNRVVGKGYHHGAGQPHAEVNAIQDAGLQAQNSTLYINLEPCAHFGRTPPCTQALIRAGVKKVVIGMRDPNPLVNGRGIAELKKAGIEVIEGILEEEARRLNEKYIKYITKKMPFVLLKSAMSLDGKIATCTGESKWISSKESRRYVRQLRSRFDAVLVGINTVLKDNPGLNTGPEFKLQGSKVPYKIIVDSSLRIPLRAKVLKNPGQVIVATTGKAPKSRIKKLKDSGVRVLVVKEKNGRVDLKALMKELAKLEISSVLIEGGGEINASAIESGIVDKILFFIAPRIIGGRYAKTPVEGMGIKRILDAIPLTHMTVSLCGRDVMVEGYPEK